VRFLQYQRTQRLLVSLQQEQATRQQERLDKYPSVLPRLRLMLLLRSHQQMEQVWPKVLQLLVFLQQERASRQLGRLDKYPLVLAHPRQLTLQPRYRRQMEQVLILHWVWPKIHPAALPVRLHLLEQPSLLVLMHLRTPIL
jgi:hypothetical protein